MFETRIDELKLNIAEAYRLAAESWLQPHIQYGTKVIRHPYGRTWLCVPEYIEAEDFLSHPYGAGPTPEQACASFDRAWTGDSPVDKMRTCVETLQKHKDCGRKLSPLEGWAVEFLTKTIEEFE